MTQRENVDEFLGTVTAAPQSVLLLDYDGTLAPFSIERQHARPYAGVVERLQQILDTGRTRLVVVTGRDAREIDPLLRLKPAPEVWGLHGLQRLRPNGACEMHEIPDRVPEALQVAQRWMVDHGMARLTEMKCGSIAIHLRSLNEHDAEELRERVLVAWFPIADRASLALVEFDGGIEMRVPDLDKGDAVRTIVQEAGPDLPVAYLGDDMTDERAFRALGARGLSVLVRPSPRKTAAHFWLKPPEELLDFLSRWLDAIQTTQLARTATY
jgi:trehalose-phosphatase